MDSNIYNKEAILGAAYLFLDKIYVFLEKKDKDSFLVNFKIKKGVEDSLSSIKGDFFNELVNQELRSEISRQNSDFRKYIVEAALFSAVYGQGEAEEDIAKTKKYTDLEDTSYEDDPLGIAVPWEEK